MKFSIANTIEILERTPGALDALLSGLSPEWTSTPETENSWDVKTVVAHLVQCDPGLWVRRLNVFLSDSPDRKFAPNDPAAFSEIVQGKSCEELLPLFRKVRHETLQILRQLQLDETHFGKTAIHPEFGEVSLSQLLSAWAAHDLNHLAQIARILAKQYKENTGPWIAYLKILKA